MKRIYILFALLIIANYIHAQREILVQYSCSIDHEVSNKIFHTFPPSIHADRVVDEILNSVGLTRNFELLAAECDKVLANTIEKKRYILYSPQFLNKLFSPESKWEVYAAMAHAIGHHLNSHEFEADEPQRRFDMELKADAFAGAILFSFDIKRSEIKNILEGIIDIESSTTHPPIRYRVEAVEGGWDKMDAIMIRDNFSIPQVVATDDNQEEARRKAEKARKAALEDKKKAEADVKKNDKRNNETAITKTTNGAPKDVNDDVKESIDDPSMRNFLEAKFPFPPPDCNSAFSLPGYAFSNCTNLGEVADKITNSLDHEGYPHRFLSVPNGFAVVTQMEQYKDDGTVIEDADTRWVHYPKQEDFSWSINYLSSLVFPKKGYLRVFVFIVTSDNYGFEGQAQKSEAASWHKHGVNRLPAKIANTPFIDDSHDISLLTYEFEVPESNHKAEQRCPCCKFQAYSHLKHSKLVDHFFE